MRCNSVIWHDILINVPYGKVNPYILEAVVTSIVSVASQSVAVRYC